MPLNLVQQHQLIIFFLHLTVDIMDETIRAAKVRRTTAAIAEETQNETLLPVSREYIPSPQRSTPSSSGSPNLACELRVGDYVGSPATTTSLATIGVSSSNGEVPVFFEHWIHKFTGLF
jgi:hypothetical protein